jgi:hypothetical protein
MIMERMTAEEAWALDDEITRADIELGLNGTGFLSQREARLGLRKPDRPRLSARWCRKKIAVSLQPKVRCITVFFQRIR